MSLRYMVTPQSPSGGCLEFPSRRLRAPSGDRASKIASQYLARVHHLEKFRLSPRRLAVNFSCFQYNCAGVSC